MAEQHRILRVLEYVGTEQFIRDSIEKRGVKGEYIVPGKGGTVQGRIREAIIGETAEVLHVGQPNAATVNIAADILIDEVEQATARLHRSSD